ncbi:MAG: hypothetical protein A3J76_03035 [Candidatus Moranbacteria bacterium RBG_13_45_13]|nr:MAG: hypothetical protein A3J76_03035 [Candidatus Moranbacteria bacterium RBG_13_45_13]
MFYLLNGMVKDLGGWRVDIWYSIKPKGGTDSYFKAPDITAARVKGKIWYGDDGEVEEVAVLTKDGKTGYIVIAKIISLVEDDTIRDKARARAKAKLSPEERRLLKID